MNKLFAKTLISPRGGVILGLSLLACLICAATLAYSFIEGWSLQEGFYMAVITVSTVGFQEVRPLSSWGRLVTSVLIVSGLGLVAYSTAKLGQSILEGELFGDIGRRRMQRELSRLNGHFIVCGYGRMGRPVAEGLKRAGQDVCIVDVSSAVEDELISGGYFYLIADATEDETLRAAGVERARALMALLPSDADNVYLTLTAKGIHRGVQVIARASATKAETKLRRGGADKVISPYEIAGTRVLEAALRPTVVEFMEVSTHREQLALGWEEISVAEHCQLAGRSIAEAEIRKRYGIIVVAIKRTDGNMVYNPAASETIQAGDILVAIGTKDSLAGVEAACGRT